MTIGISCLVAIALSLGCQASPPSGKDMKASAEGFGKKLDNLLPRNELSPEDVIDGNCFNSGRFTILGTCTVTIRKGGLLPRRGVLILEGSFPAVLSFTEEGESKPAFQLKLSPGEETHQVDVPFSSSGGTLLLKCTAPTPCTVALKRGDAKGPSVR